MLQCEGSPYSEFSVDWMLHCWSVMVEAVVLTAWTRRVKRAWWPRLNRSKWTDRETVAKVCKALGHTKSSFADKTVPKLCGRYGANRPRRARLRLVVSSRCADREAVAKCTAQSNGWMDSRIGRMVSESSSCLSPGRVLRRVCRDRQRYSNPQNGV